MPEPNHYLQFGGAALIVGAYLLLQLGKIRAESSKFSALNLVGATLLAWELTRTQQWGLLLLEVTWAIVSAWGLYRAWAVGNQPGCGPEPPAA